VHRLLLVLEDDLAALAKKGELVSRYYNPCDYFDEIMVLGMKNPVCPPELAPLFGGARVEYRFVGKPGPLRLLIDRPFYLRPWFDAANRLVGRFAPDVVRVYGVGVSGLLALDLKERLGAKFVCSSHDAYDWYRHQAVAAHRIGSPAWLRLRVYAYLVNRIEREVLRQADLNIVVYEAAARYVERCGGSNICLIYNSVSSNVPQKKDYSLSSPPRLLNLGRQTRGIKEPSRIIVAMDGVDANLEIIGEGDCHQELVRLASATPVRASRVTFRSFRPNSEIMKSLPTYDLFVYRFLNWEISKSVIEALLAGLPVVVNRKTDSPVAEFEHENFVRLVDDDPAAWREAIVDLLQDDRSRERLGRAGREYALKHFAPEVMELRHAAAYREVVEKKP
jgi:glycosyltransferase involved in cell wall biosynthesis